MPLDPPLVSNRSWDALSDSLWSGLHGIQSPKILIVWPDFIDTPELHTALNVLADIVGTLSDPDPTQGNPKTVDLVLVESEA